MTETYRWKIGNMAAGCLVVLQVNFLASYIFSNLCPFKILCIFMFLKAVQCSFCLSFLSLIAIWFCQKLILKAFILEHSFMNIIMIKYEHNLMISSFCSTISSAMNAMACVTLEDFIKPYTNMLSRTYTMISKLLVLVFGATFILFAYIASQWGGLIQVLCSFR